MKSIRIIFLIIAGISILGSAIAQNTSDSEVSPDHQGTINVASDTLTYTVYGMDCPACAGGLEKQVDKIPSVVFSEADWYKQELKIVLKQDAVLSMGELEKRVKKANFTLGEEVK